MMAAQEKHKIAAAEFLADARAIGSTDLKGAIHEAIRMVNLGARSDSNRIPLILFLTDGGPHVGDDDFQSIVTSISDLSSNKISINGVSLGSADPLGWQLVQRIAARNRGLSARLFDIGNFENDIPKKFKEMKSHARSLRGLTDIQFTFDKNLVTDLTDTTFADYAEGSDLVILGRFTNEAEIPSVLNVQLQYKDVEGKVWRETKSITVRKISSETENAEKFASGQTNYNPIKQQWAVTAVHQLLKRRTMANSQEQYDSLTLKAKELSYQYKIVSPVVSFLVRKPKSSLNLINSDKLDGRMKRDAGRAESHEVIKIV